ncbi:PQQ-binding-like beta-propeller repeat protein [Neptuniibacter sp. CAU 1671]|uniref:pyrroloquinoline quinone-dependent dehydrogenase n=1 Tax=Neptuniibacter sp. CAU 1671 TaxID=3032593 RepID=UPI0023DAD3E2|nr:PQQ-binding-like beta-propeller repeat protein [Neptuniibacter sp. CAU 1671]MDF2180569.1 PQQ-binding-like beta-propeller repeat protein [Neptuniibacter sp. CAU 1671]
MNKTLIAVSVSMLAAATAYGVPPTVKSKDSVKDYSDWPEYHRDFRGWHYSGLDQINKSNVSKLKVAWMHQPGDIAQGLQAMPVVIDGILYYSGSNNRVFAVDGATGEEIWHYYTELDEVQERSIFGIYNRGVTVGNNKVYIGSSDGHIIALDQKTGEELWKTKLTDPETCHGCNFTSPPVLAGDVLIAGPTGGDLALRNKIYALDANTGKAAWTFEVLKDDPKSWPKDTIEVGGGGAWLPGQYDAKTDTFYIGTSNPAPDFNINNRKGDNLYTSTILALDPKNGHIKWHHQEVPNDAWDFDSPYEMVLLDKDGKEMMMHLNKGGFVTLLDRHTGKVENVWQLAEEMNWVKGIDPKTGELIGRNNPIDGKSDVFCPSALGVRSWNAGAYSPKTDLWYSNSYEICNRAKVGEQKIDELAFSQPYYDLIEFEIIPPPGKDKAPSYLTAYNPYTGEKAWQIEYGLPGLSHVLATGGGLVFNGNPNGMLYAYDDKTGKELWKFNTGSGLRGGVMSYTANGKQYIVAASGFGSLFPAFASIPWPEFKNVRGGAVLIAFEIE